MSICGTLIWITFVIEGLGVCGTSLCISATVAVVIKVTSLSVSVCLPSVCSKAVELSGSSRTQAAAAAASFMTGFFTISVTASCAPFGTF